MLVGTIRRWWWKRGYPRFYRSHDYQANPYAPNAGSREGFESTARQIRALVRPAPTDIVLDLGGGDGRLSQALFGGCARVVLLDFCETALGIARRRLPENFCLLAGDMKRVPLREDRTFTKIFTYSTFPHVATEPQAIEMIRAWDRLLHAGGTLYIGDIPDRRRLFHVFLQGVPRLWNLDGVRYYVAVSMANYFSRARLKRALTDLGYEVIVVNQSPDRRFARERFDVVAKKVGMTQRQPIDARVAR